ncbi:putative membrane protein YccC [Streptosporangium becharense]|uniref:Putative membrane protein YccC n=1 Tax=Streptosporangium becharense TaxID=1816182 RepID=A0A7W9IBQ0_9ACTN|nr:FUSC family protein [Streptosporangium becharense]MBB2913719.1 putative membrane protein YccC [Streptosporangium becharense]MBB5817800.1 putative membrane protein YccC [Streptosporangium becharense]
MPPLFQRAAGRLSDAAPGWLVETVRPVPAPLRRWPMLRMALVVTAPLLVGMAAGHLVLGLLPAMAAMGTALADRGGAYRVRIIRMGATGLAGTLGYLTGSLVRGHGWWAVLVVVAVSVLSALISTGGAAGSVAGLQLLVMTVVSAGVALPGPPGVGALAFLAGVAWAIVPAVADWPFRPRAPEQAAVAAVYRALGRLFADHDADARTAFGTALRDGYDTVLGARSTAAGLDPERTRLIALLNQASLIRHALVSLRHEGREPPAGQAAEVEEMSEALAAGRAPREPRCEGGSPAEHALCSAMRGAAGLAAGGEVRADQLPYEPLGYRGRFRDIWEKMWYGHLTRVYTLRLALCMGAAAAVGEFGWFERSYWTTLTVALVIKPDFGSVFARAVQRALGTLVGTIVASVVLLLVPYGPALLVPVAVFAALLPYGMQRNWGLLATFQAPLVLLLVDLLTRGGPELAVIRLVDTLAGCVIVLLLGYLPWPGSWTAPVGPRFADAVSATAEYLRHAFDPGQTARALLRRRAYDALADLRTVFQRAMTEPPAVSRRITTWMPAMTALEQVADATAATAVRVQRGAPHPSPEAIRTLADSLDGIAADVRAGRTPRELGPTADEALEKVDSAVRSLRDTVAEDRSG